MGWQKTGNVSLALLDEILHYMHTVLT